MSLSLHSLCSPNFPSVLYPRADKITALLHPRGNPLPQQRCRTDLLFPIREGEDGEKACGGGGKGGGEAEGWGAV